MRNASRILISGASGFIGRRLAVRVRSEYPNASLECLVGVHDDAFCARETELLRAHGIEPIECDLISGQGLDRLHHPDILFHLAANTHTWERDQRCNDVGTENLLTALEPLGPECHVIFTSTVAVMDNRDSFDRPLSARTTLTGTPFSRYGRSKSRAEEYLQTQAERRGFPLTISRLSTVYGPDPRPNTFFPVLREAVARQSLASRLNWPGLTSFIHADDVVECLLSMAQSPPLPGKTILHLLATESHTVPAVVEVLSRAASEPWLPLRLPPTAWRILALSGRVCLQVGQSLPSILFNALWRFNLVVNPVFHCDITETRGEFPNLKPRLLESLGGDQ